MREVLVLLCELMCIAAAATGVAIEVGFGWGLVTGGVGWLAVAVAAQLPGKQGDG